MAFSNFLGDKKPTEFRVCTIKQDTCAKYDLFGNLKSSLMPRRSTCSITPIIPLYKQNTYLIAFSLKKGQKLLLLKGFLYCVQCHGIIKN